MRIRLIGSPAKPTAYARVNAHLAAALRARGHVLVGEGDGAVDAVVLHDLERRVEGLTDDERAPGAVHVIVRTWDFGPYPPRWAEVVREHFDQLWVHSQWNRELAVRGGVPADRVRVVPWGFDPSVFQPDGPARETSGAATTFLFVGAAVRRKGFDVLVRAWADAFAPDDDVELIVKDNTRDVFYRGQHLDVARSPTAPITYLDAELDPTALAALYRAADALVLPFRAEGFALPTLEAMACSTPPLVSRFGAVLDHCDDRSAWFVPVRRINLPVDRTMPYSTLGFEERIAEVDLCEPDPAGLADALRLVAATTPEERAARGQAAHAAAASRTWDRSAEAVEAALAAG